MRSPSARVLAWAALVLVAACSREAPRIDMTTPETAKTSMAAVRDALSEQERAAFSEATNLVLLDALGPDREAASRDAQRSEAAVKQALNGKTAAEVIAAAAEIRRRQPPPSAP